MKHSKDTKTGIVARFALNNRPFYRGMKQINWFFFFLNLCSLAVSEQFSCVIDTVLGAQTLLYWSVAGEHLAPRLTEGCASLDTELGYLRILDARIFTARSQAQGRVTVS